MKVARFFIKFSFFALFAFSVFVFSLAFYFESYIGDEIKITKGEDINLNTALPINVSFKGAEVSGQNPNSRVGDKYDVNLNLFGVIPIKTANVEVVDEKYVALLGTPFGMKIYTEGVLVIDLTEVRCKTGSINPAKKAGIKVGDYILSVDGKEITTNEDLSEIVEASNGKQMHFLIKRNNKKIHINCRAVLSSETGSYKIGIWIRDSSAGIGMLTFYSPASGVISGLGHGISDEDTDTLMKINSGQIVDAEIIAYKKGKSGNPGELSGRFGFKTLGKIVLNCENGVYSMPKTKVDTSNMVEVALKSEVKDGKAKIYCTVDGKKPRYYDCTITIRKSEYHSKIQNMLVTVTDADLLSLTGGIIQGMSGSPIIQNGKLIGAVTHVLVDDPTRGYGIFAENMLETAQSVAEQQLKEVS